MTDGGGMTPYYADDFVTLYHGDCRQMDLAALGADVIVTDPPYGIGWDTRGRSRGGQDFPAMVGDRDAFDPAFLLALELPTVVFGANHYADRLPPSPSWLVWDKRPAMRSTHQADCELAWSNLGGPARMFRFTWSGGHTEIYVNRGELANGKRRYHPTQKPIALMTWVIGRCPKGTILDPFVGSGTTLLAAKRLGRHAIGIEIEERYCEMAARRCSQEVLGLDE
jgi:site-specific DNA-methyltransferase (adenine-specific)